MLPLSLIAFITFQFSGFAMYQLEQADGAPAYKYAFLESTISTPCQLPLTTEFLEQISCCAESSTFSNSREVHGRFKLPPGTYMLIPSTFEPDQEGDYMVRILTESKAKVEVS